LKVKPAKLFDGHHWKRRIVAVPKLSILVPASKSKLAISTYALLRIQAPLTRYTFVVEAIKSPTIDQTPFIPFRYNRFIVREHPFVVIFTEIVAFKYTYAVPVNTHVRLTESVRLP